MGWSCPERPQDNIDLGFQRPNEDEVALCILTGLSPYLAWAFPRQADDYGRYLTFESVPEDELGRWKAALVGFLKKLTWEHGKPLVLKSPPHTARVRLLLELFPDARFVHIRRHPYAVFRSTKHLHQAVAPYWRLQGGHPPDDDRIIDTYLFIYEKFLNHRNLIPHGRSLKSATRISRSTPSASSKRSTMPSTCRDSPPPGQSYGPISIHRWLSEEPASRAARGVTPPNPARVAA